MSKIKTWTDEDTVSKLDGNERYTPSKYIMAARKVMGHINLDPASCAVANLVVKADEYYDKTNDGLGKDWHGRVWLNPPFTGNLGEWIYKLVEEYKSGRVTQAIVLYPAVGGVFSTGWLHLLLQYPMCIPFRRICYYRQENMPTEGHPPFSSLFTYLGPNGPDFIKVFGRYGDIVQKVR